MITTPSVNVTYLLVTLLIAFVILSFHLQGGLERITKIYDVSIDRADVGAGGAQLYTSGSRRGLKLSI